MASPQERLVALRRRRPLVDHVVRAVEHYAAVKGSLQAGAMTYFGFLSFFPILALAFTLVGWLSLVFPDSQDALVEVIQSVLPGLIGPLDTQISLEEIEAGARVAGPLAFAGVLYAGLGWVSAMRDALVVVFEVDGDQPNLVVAKLRDLGVLLTVGAVLLVSVVVSGFVGGFAEELLGWLELDEELAPLVVGVSLAVGFAANVLLFYLIFRLLARPDDVPTRSLLAGALLGAVGFEVLKRLSSLLLGSTGGGAAQAFGIALVLLVWINYFSRVVVLAASWAWTTRAAREVRDEREWARRSMEELVRVDLRESHHVPLNDDGPPVEAPRPARAFATGAAATLGTLGAVRLLRRKDPR
ncbi:YhjD/YihY/BrkB family envelope integrity protein [Nocardioides perillae]|uniref:Membrane protein n=1 Tax=Nocardioides perillae TaxID=1119534 RepID=A0A7Y9RUG0_9ACTN|nr:membrane protein [Nocardioides perillae]